MQVAVLPGSMPQCMAAELMENRIKENWKEGKSKNTLVLVKASA